MSDNKKYHCLKCGNVLEWWNYPQVEMYHCQLCKSFFDRDDIENPELPSGIINPVEYKP